MPSTKKPAGWRVFYQKLHALCVGCHDWWKNQQSTNRPLYLLLLGLFALFTSLFGLWITSLVEKTWGVILPWIGGLIICLAVIFYDHEISKAKGLQLFWKPWIVVLIISFFLMASQLFRYREKHQSQKLLLSTNGYFTTLRIATNQFFDRSNSYLHGELSNARKTLEDQKTENANRVAEAVVERNKAQSDLRAEVQEKLAWMILAQSGNTNTPLTERMDMLTAKLSENSKVFGETIREWESRRPSFEIKVNGIILDTFSVLPKASRSVFIQVKDIGKDTADRVTVSFASPQLYETNLITDSRWAPSLRYDPVGIFPVAWTIIQQVSSPYGETFNTPSFEISTNMTFPAVFLHVEAFSVGSIKHTANCVLLVN